MDDIKSVVKNVNDPLEEEWLKVVTTDYFTLLKYGSEYFKAFIETKKEELIRKTYDKCIYLVKSDIKRNLNFIDIINHSIEILIEKYPEYFNKFILDTLILLNPTEDKRGEISSGCHVRSDCKIIHCCQLPLWYYNLKKIFFKFVYIIIFTIYYTYFIPSIWYILLILPIAILLILSIIINIIKSKTSISRLCKSKPILFLILFINFILFTPLFIQILPMIPFIILMYFENYDQSIHLVCTYNSFCHYPPPPYNWVV